MIEHWMHLRYADIRQAQYRDTWACHLHREYTTLPDPGPSPLPTPHTDHPLHRNQNTDTRPTFPLFPQDR